MGLKALPSQLAALPPRLGYADRVEAEQARMRLRDQTVAWRKWYKTARWQKLRLVVLERDGYVCQQTGTLLCGKHPAPNAPVVDHIRPHRGDERLFWDINNLQSVTKEYHDSTKQAAERKGRGA